MQVPIINKIDCLEKIPDDLIEVFIKENILIKNKKYV